ncbi:monocarboxylate transporter 12-like [Pecten maximus]|uniref:monocarboxylate transporter 12-like n=1 Tax=Pecten maximus TaxID=6579 RepID=UPI0014584384|nr:monocarboxylate transporter 12-like [Pecten maximus]
MRNIDSAGSDHQDGDELQCEEEQNSWTDYSYLPIDHGWAFVIVFGCFGVCALVVGTLKSFGVILVELSRLFNVPASILIGPQCLAGFFHLSLGPVANALSERYSHRMVVFLGGFLATIGLISTSFVQSVPAFYVTYGVISGVGFGLCLSPSLTFQGFHFRKRRALASGLSASGSGAGSFALPPIIRFLINYYGLGGCLLLVGGFMFHTCVFCSLYRPPSYWRLNKRMEEKTGSKSTKDKNRLVDKDTTKSLLENTTGSDSLIKDESKDIVNKQPLNPSMILDWYSPNTHINNGHTPVNISEKDDNAKKKSVLDWSLLKNPAYIVLIIAFFSGIMGQHSLYNVLPSVANERGISDEQGAILVSVLGATDLTGRIFFGWLADFRFVERQTMYMINLILFSLIGFIVPHVTSFIGLCVMSTFLGLFTGGYSGTQIAVLADKFGVEKLSSTWGFAAFFASLALLINPFLSGVIRDVTGSWVGAVTLGTSVAAFGSGLLIVEALLIRIRL